MFFVGVYCYIRNFFCVGFYNSGVFTGRDVKYFKIILLEVLEGVRKILISDSVYYEGIYLIFINN